MEMMKKMAALVLVGLVLAVPMGCRDNTTDRVDNVEETKSPKNLGEWMEQLAAVIRATNKSGAEASRILAYASIAYYEGYAMSSDDMRSLVGQLEGLDELPSPNGSLTYNYGVIAEAAMTEVLLHHFEDAPQNIKLIISSTYGNHEYDYIVLGVTEPVVDRSRALGELIGGVINEWADADGYLDMVGCNPTMPTGAGNWEPTPPTFSSPEWACWGDLRPFTFTNADLTMLCNPGLPVAVSTDAASAYMNDITELRDLQTNLNEEQEQMALFWSDGPGTFTVPGHYITILRQLIGQNLLDGKETATAYAQLCIAMADTYISTYRLKYTYNVIRPTSFVQNNLENNWESYVVNPATPEYPSLRATMAYASAQVFTNLYGPVAFTDDTHSILSLHERNYANFTEMAEEAVFSRLYAGTNTRSTLDKSEYHGRCIAQRANELFLNQ